MVITMLGVAGVAGAAAEAPTYPFSAWGGLVKNGLCTAHAIQPKAERGAAAAMSGAAAAAGTGGPGVLKCTVVAGIKVFSFPPGVFEIDEQLLVPESTAIVGAAR